MDEMEAKRESSKEANNVKKNDGLKYELLPPEGGWGYLVAVALTIMANVTIIPMTSFGLIYGDFLKSIGDETTGTTMANGIFNTMFNITGLASNSLLNKYSYRKVALLGGVIFAVGAFSIVFVTDLFQLVMSFGVIQGIGMGLMFPAFFTALNCYFDKKLNLMNSVAQAFMIMTSMCFPMIARFLIETFGFRGCIAILAALTLNTLLGAAVLQPAEWHMKKKLLAISMNHLDDNRDKEPIVDTKEEKEHHLKPLLELKAEEVLNDPSSKYILPKPRHSIISLADRAVSVTTINRLGKDHDEEKGGMLKALAKSFDFGMFKDPVYVNIAVGMSLSFTADVAFIALIPLIVTNAGFSSAQTTLLVTVYFGSDLCARILLSIASVMMKLNNRYIFLGGSILSAIFRTAFVMRDGWYWKLATGSVLGFLRCFIQTPLPCVISDAYSDKFATAFSLYMAVCGFISLIFGPLQSVVKSVTQSDVMVVHLLTLCYLTCSITWIIELVYKKLKGNGDKNKK